MGQATHTVYVANVQDDTGVPAPSVELLRENCQKVCNNSTFGVERARRAVPAASPGRLTYLNAGGVGRLIPTEFSPPDCSLRR